LVEVWLVDEWFEIVQYCPPKVRNGKEYFHCILPELSFTSTEVNLALKYKCAQIVRVFPTEGVWFFYPPIFFLALEELGWLLG